MHGRPRIFAEQRVGLNDLNATWVGAMRRVSSDLLLDLLEGAGQQLAWRVFFNAASAGEAESLARCSGDPDLGNAVLQLRSVMV